MLLHTNSLNDIAQLETRHQFVDERELNAVFEMSELDTTCVTCLKLHCNSIAMDALQLIQSFWRHPAIIDYVVEKYWPPFANELFNNFTRFGFSPFYIIEIDVDGQMDKEWMKEFGHTRTSETGYITKAKIPMVPPFMSWCTVISAVNPYQPTLISFPRQDSSYFMIGRNSEPITPTSRPPLQTISYTSSTMPRLNGRLRSPMSSLLMSYTSLAQFNKFGTMAAFNRSHPPLVIQHEKRDFKIEETTIQREYANSDIGHLVTDQKYSVQVGGLQSVSESQETFGSRKGRPKIAVGVYSDPTRALNMDTALTHPVQDAIFTIPPGLVVAPQPTQAVEPADYQFRYTQHVQAVCSVFGVPISMVLPSMSKGNRDMAEFDMQQFTRSVTAEQVQLKGRLEEIFAFVMDISHHVALDLHTHSHANLETLVFMYEIGAIPREVMNKESMRRVGLVHDSSLSDESSNKRVKMGERIATVRKAVNEEGTSSTLT
jgi:hypothetical protein